MYALIRRIFITSAITGVRIGTAYTLFAAFLLLINVHSCNNYDYRHNGYDYNVFHTAYSFRIIIINKLFAFYFLICFYAHCKKNCNKHYNSYESADKACAESTRCNQSTYLVNKETYRKACAELKPYAC